jgi:hypothetical protein
LAISITCDDGIVYVPLDTTPPYQSISAAKSISGIESKSPVAPNSKFPPTIIKSAVFVPVQPFAYSSSVATTFWTILAPATIISEGVC